MVNVVFLCSGLKKLAIQSLSRPLRVEVERESVKWKALRIFLVSLDRFVFLHNNLRLNYLLYLEPALKRKMGCNSDR